MMTLNGFNELTSLSNDAMFWTFGVSPFRSLAKRYQYEKEM